METPEPGKATVRGLTSGEKHFNAVWLT